MTSLRTTATVRVCSRSVSEQANQFLKSTYRSPIPAESLEYQDLLIASQIGQVVEELIFDPTIDIAVAYAIAETFNLGIYFAFGLKAEMAQLATITTNAELDAWVAEFEKNHARVAYRNEKFGCKAHEVFGLTYLDLKEADVSSDELIKHIKKTLMECFSVLKKLWLETVAADRIKVMREFMLDRLDKDKNYANTISSLSNWGKTISGKIKGWLDSPSNARHFKSIWLEEKNAAQELDSLLSTQAHRLLDTPTQELLADYDPDTQAQEMKQIIKSYFSRHQSEFAEALHSRIPKDAIDDYFKSDFSNLVFNSMFRPFDKDNISRNNSDDLTLVIKPAFSNTHGDAN
jgi:hypothetical protein